jgi:hypothetical protein
MPDNAQDIVRLALVERHQATGEIVNGFVQGFGFDVRCAVAATVAHDSHHMLIVGTNPADMALAANTLADVGGGVVVIRDGHQLALVELPIAGLMSAERAEIVAEKSSKMVQAMKDCGCELHNAYIQLTFLALVVIPELRISDMGLVDVTQFRHIPVIEVWYVASGTEAMRIISVEKQITNTTSHDVLFALEPWGDACLMKPGETVIITGQGPEGGILEIDQQEDVITVYGWIGSTLQATINGEFIWSGDMPVPSVRPGMSTKQFVDSMFKGVPVEDQEPKQ